MLTMNWPSHIRPGRKKGSAVLHAQNETLHLLLLEKKPPFDCNCRISTLLHFDFNSSLADGELQSSQQTGPVLCEVLPCSPGSRASLH